MQFIILIISLFFSSDLYALCKFENSTSANEVKYTIQESINVDDIKGHVIRIFKTETNHKKSEKNCEGLRVVKTDFFGFCFIDMLGPSDTLIKGCFVHKQTIDHIKHFNSFNPYDFGRISYLHSQNDILSAGGRVKSLSVSLAVPFSEDYVESFFLNYFLVNRFMGLNL